MYIVDDNSIYIASDDMVYEFSSKIGTGGNATVHPIKNFRDNCYVLKIMHKQYTDVDKQRFEREIQSIRRLYTKGANVPEILMYNIGDSRFSYIMRKYLTLQEYSKELLTHSCEKKIDMLINLTETINLCHENGYFHRDIKYHNILINDHKFLVCDFGIVYTPFDEKITRDREPGANIIPQELLANYKYLCDAFEQHHAIDIYLLSHFILTIMSYKYLAPNQRLNLFEKPYNYLNCNHNLGLYRKKSENVYYDSYILNKLLSENLQVKDRYMNCKQLCNRLQELKNPLFKNAVLLGPDYSKDFLRIYNLMDITSIIYNNSLINFTDFEIYIESNKLKCSIKLDKHNQIIDTITIIEVCETKEVNITFLMKNEILKIKAAINEEIPSFLTI